MILQGMEGRKGYGHRGQDVKYKKSHYIFVFLFLSLYLSFLLASFLSFVPLSGIIRWIGRPCIQNPGATPRCIFYFANGNNVLIQLRTHIIFFLNNPFFLFFNFLFFSLFIYLGIGPPYAGFCSGPVFSLSVITMIC